MGEKRKAAEPLDLICLRCNLRLFENAEATSKILCTPSGHLIHEKCKPKKKWQPLSYFSKEPIQAFAQFRQDEERVKAGGGPVPDFGTPRELEDIECSHFACSDSSIAYNLLVEQYNGLWGKYETQQQQILKEMQRKENLEFQLGRK